MTETSRRWNGCPAKAFGENLPPPTVTRAVATSASAPVAGPPDRHPQGVAVQLSTELDLHVHTRRQIQLHQGIDGLVGGIHDIHDALVGAYLVLVPCILVHMG